MGFGDFPTVGAGSSLTTTTSSECVGGVDGTSAGSAMPGIDTPAQSIAGDAAVNPMDEPSGDLTFQESLDGFENGRVYQDEDGNTFYGFTDASGGDQLLSENEFKAMEALAAGGDEGATEFLTTLGAGDSYLTGLGIDVGEGSLVAETRASFVDVSASDSSAPEGDLTHVGRAEGFENTDLYRDDSGTEFYVFTPPNAEGTPGGSEYMLSKDEVAALQATPEGQDFLRQLDGGASSA